MNTTSANVDLDNGDLSSAILEKTGPSIQNEIKTNAPKGLNEGQIVTTSGGNVKAWKIIYHTLVCDWDEGQGRSEIVSHSIPCTIK